MPQKSKLNLPPLNLGKETIGERIARLRKERGLSQYELAEKMGLVQTLISRYENNQRGLSAEMVARFAIAFDVSTDEIIGLGSNGKEKFVPNLKWIKILNQIEKLSEYKQKMIIGTITSFIRDNLPKD